VKSRDFRLFAAPPDQVEGMLDRGIVTKELDYPVKPHNDELLRSFPRRRESNFSQKNGCPTENFGHDEQTMSYEL
jgi:hypothetical protein